MSSKAIIEKKDDSPAGASRWESPLEVAPSIIQDDAALIARWIGAFGLAFVVLAGVTLGVQAYGRNTFVPAWLAYLLGIFGVGGLLFHAASDAEFQIRRVYMGLGYVLLGLGALLSVLPYHETVGALFLPYGLYCLVLGGLVTLAFVRNETEVKFRDIATFVLGGGGGVLALVGFIWSNVYGPKFLLPYGVVLILLGFAFVWAFIAVRGIADDIAHWGAQGVGALGMIVFLIALGRSYLPPILERMKFMSPTSPYTMPAGLLLMGTGLLYLALAVGYCSDRQIVVLTRRELGALFYSPLAYMVLFGYVILGGLIFANFVMSSLWEVDPFAGKSGPAHVAEPIVRNYIISWFPVICVLMLVPVLTMRLFSEEHRTGTLEMMFTAPVEEPVVVVSKFLAALLFFMLVWVPWGLYLVSLRVEGGASFDYMPVIGFAVVLLFSGGSFLSVGLFFSSLTRNQLAAAVMTFVYMLTLVLIFFTKRLLPSTGAMSAWAGRLSFVDTWLVVLDGKLVPRDLVLYLSETVWFLFLTVKVLESRKWR